MFSPLSASESTLRDRLKRGGPDNHLYSISEGNKGYRAVSGIDDNSRVRPGRGDDNMFLRQIENITEALNESNIRASRLRVEIRNDKSDVDVSLQQLRSLLSDEVATRKKNIQKASNAFEKLNSLAAKTDKDVSILASEVEERFIEVDSTICKIATNFSDQLVSLQASTKNAVQTLQVDQKSLAAKVSHVATENTKKYELLKTQTVSCAERVSQIENTLSQSKASGGLVESATQRADRIQELEKLLQQEKRERQEMMDSVNAMIQANQQAMQGTMDRFMAEVTGKLASEALTRTHALNGVELRMRDLISKEVSTLESIAGSSERSSADCRARLERMADTISGVDSSVHAAEDRLMHSLHTGLKKQEEDRLQSLGRLENRLQEVFNDGHNDYDRKLSVLDDKIRKNYQVVLGEVSQTKASILEANRMQNELLTREIASVSDKVASETMNRRSDLTNCESEIRQYIGAELYSISGSVKANVEHMQQESTKQTRDLARIESNLKQYIDAHLFNMTGEIRALGSKPDDASSMTDVDRTVGVTYTANSRPWQSLPQDSSVKSTEELLDRMSVIESNMSQIEASILETLRKEAVVREEQVKSISLAAIDPRQECGELIDPLRTHLQLFESSVDNLQKSILEEKKQRDKEYTMLGQGIAQNALKCQQIENDCNAWSRRILHVESGYSAGSANISSYDMTQADIQVGLIVDRLVNDVEQQQKDERLLSLLDSKVREISSRGVIEPPESSANIAPYQDNVQAELSAMQLSISKHITTQTSQITELRESVAALGDRTRVEVASSVDEINVVKNIVQELQSAVLDLKQSQQSVSATSDLSEVDTPQWRQVVSQVVELKSALSVMKDSHAELHARVTADVTRQTEGAIVRLKMLSVQMEELQSTVQELQESQGDLRSSVLADVGRQTEGAVTRLIQLNSQVEQVQATLTELQKGAEALRSSVTADVARQTEGAIVRLKMLSVQMEELQSTVQELQESQGDLRSSVLADVGRQTEGAVTRLKILSGQAEQFDLALKQLQASKSTSTSPLSSGCGEGSGDATARVSALETALAAIQKEAEAFRADISTDVSRKADGVVTQLQSLGLEVEVIQADLVELKEGQEALRASVVADVGRKTEGAVSRMKLLEAEVQRLQSMISTSDKGSGKGASDFVESSGVDENLHPKAESGQDNNFLMNLGFGSPRESSLGDDEDPAVQEEGSVQCMFCGKKDSSWNDESLDMHYWKECPLLVPCNACNEIVEIGSLNSHLLDECEKKDSYQACYTTGLSIRKKVFSQWNKGPDCKPPPPNCIYCPLCLDAVPYSTEAWKEHHVRDCSANMRKYT